MESPTFKNIEKVHFCFVNKLIVLFFFFFDSTYMCCHTIFVLLCLTLEKAMAPHSSTLAWKIPWMEEPGRLQSMGSLRVGYD